MFGRKARPTAKDDEGFAPRKRRWVRRLLLAFAAVVGLGATLVLLLPVYSPLFSAVVAKQIGRALGRPTELERIRLNLLKGTAEVDGLRIRELTGEEAFVLEHAEVDLSLRPLLKGDVELPQLTVTGLRARLVMDEDGVLNWQSVMDRLSGDDAGPSESAESPSVTANLDFSGGEIAYSDHRRGLEFVLSGLEITARVEGLDNINHELSTEMTCRSEGSWPFEQRLALDWRGQASLPLRHDQGRASAQGELSVSSPEGGASGSGTVDRRRLIATYTVAVEPARQALSVPELTVRSDHLDLTVADLHVSDVGWLAQRVAGLAGADGGEPASGGGASAEDEWTGTVEAVLRVDGAQKHLGRVIEHLTGFRLEEFGGTLNLAASLHGRTSEAIRVDEKLYAEGVSFAGQLPGTATRPELYGIQGLRIAQDGLIKLTRDVASFDGSLGVSLAGRGERADQLIASEAHVELVAHSSGELAPGLAARYDTSLDLALLDSTFGPLARALGVLPAGIRTRGHVQHHLELRRNAEEVTVGGGGKADGLSIALPVLAGQEQKELHVGQVVWGNGVTLGLGDGRLRSIDFPDSEATYLALSDPGVSLAFSGGLDRLDQGVDGGVLDQLAMELRGNLGSATKWLSESGLPVAADVPFDGDASVTVVLDGPLDSFKFSPSLSLRGRFITDAHGAEEAPEPPDVEARLAPVLRVEGLLAFLSDRAAGSLSLAFVDQTEAPPELRVGSSEGVLLDGRLTGQTTLAEQGPELHQVAAEVVVHVPELQRALARWSSESGLGIGPRMPDGLSLGGTARLHVRADGVPKHRMVLDAGLDLTQLDVAFGASELAPVFHKVPGQPMSLSSGATAQIGPHWDLAVDALELRLLDVYARAGIRLNERGELSGPDAGRAYFEVPEFSLGALKDVVPIIGRAGLSDAKMSLSIRDVTADLASPRAQGSLRAHLAASRLSLADIQTAMAELRGPQPTPSVEAAQEPAAPEAGAKPTYTVVLRPEVRELLRGFKAEFRFRVDDAELIGGNRIRNAHGAVLFNEGRGDNSLGLTAVADVFSPAGHVGRVSANCAACLDAAPFDTFDFAGRFIGGPLRGTRISGWADGISSAAPTVQARLTLPRLDIGPELLSLLPEEHQLLLRAHSLGGTVWGSGFTALGTGVGARYSADIEMSGGRFESQRPPVIVHGLSAALHADEKRLQCRQFRGRAWGGKLDGGFLVNLETPAGTSPAFECQMELQNASLRQLASQIGGPAADLSGRMAASLDARGSTTDPFSIVGRASVYITEARLAEVPLIAGLFNVLSLGLPEKTVFDSVELSVQMENGVARLTSILLSSPALDITGKGTISINGDLNLVMAAATSARPKKGIPLVSDALTFAMRGIQRSILPPVRVTGKVGQPKFRLMLMNPIRRPLASIAGLIPLLPEPGTQDTGGTEAGVRSLGTW